MKRKTKKFNVIADMGCVKIGSKNLSIFIHNGFGDGSHEVIVANSEGIDVDIIPAEFDFQGHFTVKEKGEVFLYSYDCGGEEIYEFPLGRWFAYSQEGIVLIQLMDDDLEA